MDGGSSSGDARVTNCISRSAQTLVVFSSAKEEIQRGLLWVRWDRSVKIWCMVALRGNRGPVLRYLLATENRCRVIVGFGSICTVSGKGCDYETAT